VKTVVAIFCGIVLALVPLAAQPALCAAPAVHSCCKCGGKMACCSARQNSAMPDNATLVRTAPQNELSLLSQILSLPTPLTARPASISTITARLKPAASPIYARDCARLI